ncbi:unnamed protein product [Haemonchus placei]|uniref:Large ribosomal subunit protein eL28 n=1 Tax=Haemonchus placei TaxID=6290 RepID=A0A0N4WQG7_HAEPC|nr:unnamed protein product [Haemonchus placei]
MSADLTWQIIRKNNCFLRRQKGIKKHFSVEPFNLRGINSPRFNGLISKKAMDIAPAKDDKEVVVSLKVPGDFFTLFGILFEKPQKKGSLIQRWS